MNFAALVDVHRRAQPTAPALHCAGQVWTWDALGSAVDRLAYRMHESGVTVGDRVALLFRNSPHFVIGFLASMKLGACPVPLNTRWSAAELDFVLRDSGARLLLADSAFGAAAREAAADRVAVALSGRPGPGDAIGLDAWLAAPAPRLLTVPRQDDDMADLMYTAGTSGRPKGVIHHHGFLWAGAFARADFFNFSRDDVGLSVSALFHIGGLAVMLVAVALGCQLVLLPRWNVRDFFHAIHAQRVTYMHLVTTVLLDIVQADSSASADLDLSSIRVTFGGGGSASREQLAEYERRVGGLYCEGYGRTEASGVAWNPPDLARRKSNSNGLVLQDVARVRIVAPSGDEAPAGESGEITLRGDGVVRAYWNRPDLDAMTFDPQGWMHTGDIGSLDEDGFIYFHGRDDHMIKTGGENVYPNEVESVLLSMPEIAEAAVIGLPDSRLGQRVAALIVPRDPGLTEEEVERWCRQHLAGFKLPRTMRFVDRIDKLGSFKIDYNAVRTRLSD